MICLRCKLKLNPIQLYVYVSLRNIQKDIIMY